MDCRGAILLSNDLTPLLAAIVPQSGMVLDDDNEDARESGKGHTTTPTAQESQRILENRKDVHAEARKLALQLHTSDQPTLRHVPLGYRNLSTIRVTTVATRCKNQTSASFHHIRGLRSLTRSCADFFRPRPDVHKRHFERVGHRLPSWTRAITLTVYLFGRKT